MLLKGKTADGSPVPLRCSFPHLLKNKKFNPYSAHRSILIHTEPPAKPLVLERIRPLCPLSCPLTVNYCHQLLKVRGKGR